MYVIDDVHYFTSLSDFIDTVKNAPTIVGRNNSSQDGDYDFCGTRTIAEAWELAERGDEKNLDKISSELTRRLYASPKAQTTNSVVGHTPNVPLYLQGVPQNMVHRHQPIFQNKIVNVLVNTAVGAWTSRSEIEEKAISILSTIMNIEAQGYRVNLYKMIGSTSDGRQVLGFIKLKDDRERINLKKMMFPMTHPSMQRRLDFRFRECFGKNDVTHSGYGSQRDWDKKSMAKHFGRLCQGDFLYAEVFNFDPQWADSVKKVGR